MAVLISTEFAESAATIYDADAWYDVVHTYCMLRLNGFTDENILVLYGFGSDGFYTKPSNTAASYAPIVLPQMQLGPERYYQEPYCEGLETVTGDPLSLSVEHAITDFPMVFADESDSNSDGKFYPQLVFECLAGNCNTDFVPFISKLTNSDFLFVWWRSHGYPVGPVGGDRTTYFTLTKLTPVSASQVIKWVEGVSAGRSALVFETCHSGCMEEDMAPIEDRSILLASSGCEEISNNSFQPDVYHGVWSYWLAGILQGALPNRGLNEIQKVGEGVTVIDLSIGGPLDTTFEQASRATTALFGDQNPKKVVVQSLDHWTKIDLDNPMIGPPMPPPTPTADPTPTPTPKDPLGGPKT